MAAIVPKINDIVWSANRSPVPAVFAGRIPEDVWARTYDGVRARYAADLEFQRKFLEGATGGLPLIPCCVCCIICSRCAGMGQYQQDIQQQEMEWLALVRAEQANYQPYGISVAIATEMRLDTMGDHSTRRTRMQKVNVGLRFEAAELVLTPTGIEPIVAMATPITMERDSTERDSKAEPSGGLGSELDKLAKLHASGALSDTEYATAKAKLLS